MPRKTLERHEPLARDDVSPLKGTGVRRSPRGPFESKAGTASTHAALYY
jgi:hypothetical protein